MAQGSGAHRVLKAVAAFGDYVWHVLSRFWNDHCFGSAAQLSYTTLLAMVPFFAISAAVLAAFPVFDQARADLQQFILANFLPENVAVVSEEIDRFIAQTRELTAVGTVALAVTAIILLDTIDTKFNEIWRQPAVRPLLGRVVIYWAMITLTPLLIGGSVAASSLVIAEADIDSVLELQWLRREIMQLLPLLLMAAALTVAYMVLPYRRVPVAHALVGAFVAALLFELLKYGFALYFRAFPVYQTLYGALSVIPMVLIWMYLGWCAVLFGAQIAAAIPEWHTKRLFGKASESATTRQLFGALAILQRLFVSTATGVPAQEEDLADDLAARSLGLGRVLERLRDERLVVRTEGGGWVLARDPGSVTVAHVVEALRLPLVPGLGHELADGAWVERFDGLLARLQGSSRQVLSVSLAELFADDRPSADEGEETG